MSNVNKTSGSVAAGAAADAAKTQPVTLTAEQRGQVRVRKATCPFMGSAVNEGALTVRNSATNPLASIDDVKALGDSGGGDLGSVVLTVFAQGNHARMLGTGGQLTDPVPAGMLGLNFPGSQGAHPGHSGILMGDPTSVTSGRFDPAADSGSPRSPFDRLMAKAKDGHISRSAFAAFIAENLMLDPNSKVFGGAVGDKIRGDVAQLVGAEGKALRDELASHHSPPGTPLSPKERDVFQKLTKLTGEDNLVGSAGEYGLMFAFLANSPKTVMGADGEPALSVEDVTAMFRDGELPDGWRKWPKTAQDWVSNTTALTVDAGKIYLEKAAAKKIAGWIP